MKNLTYEVNKSQIYLKEQDDAGDCAFMIQAKTNDALNRLRQMKIFFESDKVSTDILFYPQKDKVYQVIVRKEVYTAFIVHLFQLQLLKTVQWNGIA
ncbi:MULTISPECIES: hypothetical protein [Sporolactobacillus]|uniref:Uncharacterized protein n=2 Tax=Sporolactobacillus TaxID=2077 RepID=A0A0U1QPM0_9BACL|nr:MULTISPECIES: hypothetical protein [Sporolactobacillus]KLI02748.1 hypothetical protein SINU_06490 [Sporolactobacillus inulinus CASD]QAA21410.1 hypothetical protein C0674_01520 [Sporolactobacillus terrae]QAA24382.1 hypothetical protein C0679_01500 [Sporolactobacillus terrae]UAK16207.1 hypothetical protein K7399_14785 [Sporolactobacillus terrae]GEB77574.1 hypothetical protein SIN01_19190 [Sporolactobacillus inulinus]